jgi:hypothetical protein
VGEKREEHSRWGTQVIQAWIPLRITVIVDFLFPWHNACWFTKRIDLRHICFLKSMLKVNSNPLSSTLL